MDRGHVGILPRRLTLCSGADARPGPGATAGHAPAAGAQATAGVRAGRRRGDVRPAGPGARTHLGGLVAGRVRALLERLACLVALLRSGQPADQYAQTGDPGSAEEHAPPPLAGRLTVLLGTLGEHPVRGAPGHLGDLLGLRNPASHRLLGGAASAAARPLAGRHAPAASLLAEHGGSARRLDASLGAASTGRRYRLGDRVPGDVERLAELVRHLGDLIAYFVGAWQAAGDRPLGSLALAASPKHGASLTGSCRSRSGLGGLPIPLLLPLLLQRKRALIMLRQESPMG